MVFFWKEGGAAAENRRASKHDSAVEPMPPTRFTDICDHNTASAHFEGGQCHSSRGFSCFLHFARIMMALHCVGIARESGYNCVRVDGILVAKGIYAGFGDYCERQVGETGLRNVSIPCDNVHCTDV